ncbi:MAG: trehalose-phosphatase [Terrimesophilobacter sp.]
MSALSPFLENAIARIAATEHLLLALDFDGTLAPTVDDPDSARAHPDATAAIVALIGLPNTRVAIVSGRALGSLEKVIELPDAVILVGSHGAEFRIDGEESGPKLELDEHVLLDRLCTTLEDVASRYPGARTERKPAGCGLHTRLSSSADAASAWEHALREVGTLDSASDAGSGHRISHRTGKDILEFTVRNADKGMAIGSLRERVDATAVMFIGDDVTDEDGFVALSETDVGIKVGDGHTAAEYRVAGTNDVVTILQRLAGERERVLSS